MKNDSWERSSKVEEVGAVIVGGGIAGVATAYNLGHSDFKLIELSNRLGGTSAAQAYNDLIFSQGAHYELAYPDYYGEEVLRLFEQLNIIEYQPWKKMWSFVDAQHIIPFHRRQQCYEDGKFRPDVIEEGSLKNRFYEIQEDYLGEMKLPTRLIDSKFHHLNDITYLDFLNENMQVDDRLKHQLDYHMMDDWGGRSDQVSALAGIHYFMCRPYLKESVDLFSPPQGNAYFLNRMIEKLPAENFSLNQMVAGIEKEGDNFLVDVLDFSNQRAKRMRTANVIYAGQKHALKYVYPKEAGLFDQVQAPWMVVNFVCKGDPKKFGFWQNEFIGENQSFLGFIDSGVQDRSQLKGKRILTAYYCLQPTDREYLVTIPDHKEEIANETLSYIQEMLEETLDVEACFINTMGHAMSIPTTGFLLRDANDQDTDLAYAGVDNGRLPLLYEAVDSGIMAAERIKN